MERGARILQARERVGECEPRRADALGRFDTDAARALDELLDGDGSELLRSPRRRARLLGLAQKFPEQGDDVALDDCEVLDKLCGRPAVGRGAESLLRLAQALDGLEEARARAVDVFVDFGDAAEVHKGGSLLVSAGDPSRPSTAACGETCRTCQRGYLKTGSSW